MILGANEKKNLLELGSAPLLLVKGLERAQGDGEGNLDTLGWVGG